MLEFSRLILNFSLLFREQTNRARVIQHTTSTNYAAASFSSFLCSAMFVLSTVMGSTFFNAVLSRRHRMKKYEGTFQKITAAQNDKRMLEMAGSCVFACSAPQSSAYHPTLWLHAGTQHVRATSDNHRTNGAGRDSSSLGQTDRHDRSAKHGGEAREGSREETKPTRADPAADDDARHAGESSEKVDEGFHTVLALRSGRKRPAQTNADEHTQHHYANRKEPNRNPSLIREGFYRSDKECGKEPRHDR